MYILLNFYLCSQLTLYYTENYRIIKKIVIIEQRLKHVSITQECHFRYFRPNILTDSKYISYTWYPFRSRIFNPFLQKIKNHPNSV